MCIPIDVRDVRDVREMRGVRDARDIRAVSAACDVFEDQPPPDLRLSGLRPRAPKSQI